MNKKVKFNFNIGFKKGHLTVLSEPFAKNKNGRNTYYVRVKCDCKNETLFDARIDRFTNGTTWHCGCQDNFLHNPSSLKYDEKSFILNNHIFLSIEEISKRLNKSLKCISLFYIDNNLTIINNQFKIGDTFNYLTIVSNPFYGKKKNQWSVYASCKCGNSDKKEYLLSNIVNNRIISCGCYRSIALKNKDMTNCVYTKNKIRPHRFYNSIPYRIFAKIKSIAKKTGRDFNITIEYLDELWKKQKGRCALTNKKLIFHNGKFKFKVITASLDRIDSTKGYIIGNVQWVHKIVNRIKQEHSMGKLLHYCKSIANYKQPKIPYCSTNSNNIRRRKEKFKNCGNIISSRWNQLEARAKRDSILLIITPEYAWNIFVNQLGYCAITGLPIAMFKNYSNGSIDRLDNHKGYEENNIQWVLTDINYMRGLLSIEEFKYWCILIYKYSTLK